MPNVSAPVRKPISVNGIEYSPGDIFYQPVGFEDKYVVYLWLKEEIGDFDFDLLIDSVKEWAIDPERQELLRLQLLCPSCH